MHTVYDHTKLFLIASQICLYTTSLLVQTRHHVCMDICTVGKIVEQSDPLLSKFRNDPTGPKQLLFTLARIDTMFCQNKRPVKFPFAKTSKNTTVSCRSGMIQVCLWNRSGHQIQFRQQHGAHRMEKIRKGNVGIRFQTDVLNDLQKLFTHQYGKRICFFSLKQFKKDIPVCLLTGNQIIDLLKFPVI